MSYILGANTESQAKKFVQHLSFVTSSAKGISVVSPKKVIKYANPQIIQTTTSGATDAGIILGTLMDDGSVSVIYDPSGEYPTGSVISVSLLSAVYGSHGAPGVHVVVFRAQVVGVGGTELNELV